MVFNTQPITTRQVEENIEHIGGNRATGLDGSQNWHYLQSLKA